MLYLLLGGAVQVSLRPSRFIPEPSPQPHKEAGGQGDRCSGATGAPKVKDRFRVYSLGCRV